MAPGTPGTQIPAPGGFPHALFVAAPLGGMTLAQLGADVIRFDDIKGGIDAKAMEKPVIGWGWGKVAEVRDALTRFRREHVGFVFQFFNLVPTLTAADSDAMAKEYKDLVVGLDIGTAKVMAVVAEVMPGGDLRLARSEAAIERRAPV